MSHLKPEHKPSKFKLEVAIVATVIGLLVTFLLDRLNTIQLEIERQKINTQVQYFRLSLAETWLSRNIQHKSMDIKTFENSNPMLLIAEPPSNYIGELNTHDLAQSLQENTAVWFFDTQKKQLVYIMNNGEKLRYKLAGSHGNSEISRLTNGNLDLVAWKQ